MSECQKDDLEALQWNTAPFASGNARRLPIWAEIVDLAGHTRTDETLTDSRSEETGAHAGAKGRDRC